MTGLDVLCVGIAVADVMAKPIDRLPEWDRLGTFDHIEHHIGGCAVNTAVDLVGLGASASVSACLGRDGAGAFVRRSLEAAGVGSDGLVETDDAATSYTFVMIGSDGRRRYLHHVGANARFSESQVPSDLIARARVLHLGGSLLMPALDGAPTARLLARARELGAITSMDTAYNPNVNSRALIEPCLPHLDIFMPSIEEARAITGESDPEVILAHFSAYPIEVLGVKLGAEGCAVRVQGKAVRFPAYEVDVVDGSGAGDAFMAGLLYGVLHDWPINRGIPFANATAAHCIQAIGCSAGVPDAQTVAAFQQERDR
ncbi:MAG: carbohydrate kinase family protein [Armatimonadetes bacterium]|nr:carbohydrate kinase family protein [Armatimonadota bacterium]